MAGRRDSLPAAENFTKTTRDYVADGFEVCFRDFLFNFSLVCAINCFLRFGGKSAMFFV